MTIPTVQEVDNNNNNNNMAFRQLLQKFTPRNQEKIYTMPQRNIYFL